MRIGLLTSGGDSPGMNAAIRAVVRTAVYYGYEAYGIYRGYQGLIDGHITRLTAESVSGIIGRGGTILRSGRCMAFHTPAGRQKAYETLLHHGIHHLIVIGGDGSFRGAQIFTQEHPDIRIIGLPGTIDNDLFGTDWTIGFDTAVNIVVEAIDRIRDTAAAMGRLFLVEVMGRDTGFIALSSAVAGGAEAVLVPETKTDFEAIVRTLERGWQRQKSSAIIVVAEGDEEGGALEVSRKLASLFPHYEIKAVILGHIQRGGAPTYWDRLLASQLATVAVEKLAQGHINCMVGLKNQEIVLTPFEKATKYRTQLSPFLLRLVEILSV